MTTTETYREYYEFESDHYRTTPEHEAAWRHRRKLVHLLLPKHARGPILDAGCGDGALASDLSRHFGTRVVGIDLAHKRLAYAASHAAADVQLAQTSIYDLPFGDGAFEIVVCTDLLEHLDDPERAMRELVRVTSKFVVVSVPYSIQVEKTFCVHCMRSYFLYGHQHSFGKDGLERLASAAGGAVLRFEHVVPMFECRRYKWFPPLKWLIWDHFKDTGTLGALIEKRGGSTLTRESRHPG